MEPELQAPRLTPENAPDQSQDNLEKQLYRSPEVSPETHQEHQEQRSEAASRVAESTQIALPTPVIVPSMHTDDDAAVTTDSPLVANDDDLIEKEWVDKAKQIISETRDNPHAREEAIARLQADYLRKRYGKELGSSK
ncbi:hypothetical protein B7Z28_01765 [Candidatus Saccharibacteria bacterium 32-45-3]|nr:MAG: hypothetical protein B7Z28_01765 [Candidatus Saccharibacteria bacterium 32-45-3]